MRVEFGMKESTKTQLVRTTWAGLVNKLGNEKWQREKMPRKWKRNGGEEDRIGD